MMRRAFIVLILFFKMSKNSGIQLILLMYAQISYTIFIGLMKPYAEKFDNKIELFNETLATYMLMSMQVLNDPSKPSLSREYIGYLLLGITAFLIISNIVIIGWFMIVDIKHQCRLRYKVLYVKNQLKNREQVI